ALLILAAARPVIGDNATTSWIVLLDASLSMNATDIEPNRFEAARNTVVRRWGLRSHTDSVSLVTVGARSRLVAFDWNTGPDFGQLVDDLVPGAGQADWAGAARRAARLAVRDSSARVAVITDDYGVQAAQQALAAVGLASESVEVVSVGSTLANVGVGSVGAA